MAWRVMNGEVTLQIYTSWINPIAHQCIKMIEEKILTQLNIFEEKKNQRASPPAPPEYTELVVIVPCDDGWPGYDETV